MADSALKEEIEARTYSLPKAHCMQDYNTRERRIFLPSTSSGLLFSGWDNPEGWGEGGGIHCSTDQANYLKKKIEIAYFLLGYI